MTRKNSWSSECVPWMPDAALLACVLLLFVVCCVLLVFLCFCFVVLCGLNEREYERDGIACVHEGPPHDLQTESNAHGGHQHLSHDRQ